MTRLLAGSSTLARSEARPSSARTLRGEIGHGAHLRGSWSEQVAPGLRAIRRLDVARGDQAVERRHHVA